MRDIALLIDSTRSFPREDRLALLESLEGRNVKLLVLYGIRAYPLCENNCKINKELVNMVSLLPDLDGPPEPYRAVKEAVEYIIQYSHIIEDLILIWSAPRKPLVDMTIAFNLAESVGSRLHLVISRPHSARWLVKIINKLAGKSLIIPRKNQSTAKAVEKLVAELLR